MTRQIPLTILTFFLSTATGLPAFAGDSPRNDEPSTTVKLQDLDLNTAAGTRMLLERLSKAADRVCDEQAKSFASLGYNQVHLACRRLTLAAAVEKFHHAQLSALFAATSQPARR